MKHVLYDIASKLGNPINAIISLSGHQDITRNTVPKDFRIVHQSKIFEPRTHSGWKILLSEISIDEWISGRLKPSTVSSVKRNLKAEIERIKKQPDGGANNQLKLRHLSMKVTRNLDKMISNQKNSRLKKAFRTRSQKTSVKFDNSKMARLYCDYINGESLAVKSSDGDRPIHEAIYNVAHGYDYIVYKGNSHKHKTARAVFRPMRKFKRGSRVTDYTYTHVVLVDMVGPIRQQKQIMHAAFRSFSAMGYLGVCVAEKFKHRFRCDFLFTPEGRLTTGALPNPVNIELDEYKIPAYETISILGKSSESYDKRISTLQGAWRIAEIPPGHFKK